MSDPTGPCPASDGDHAVDPAEPPVTRDPWEKAGWLMAAIWLVFLAFPLISVFAVTDNAWLRAANVLVILTFAGVYTLSFIRLPESEPARLARHAATYLPILIGLIVVAGLTIRSNALSMGAYVVAFSVYAMPLRLALFSTATLLMFATVLPLLDTSDGPPWWMYDLIILLVAVACLIPKQLDERAERKRARDKTLTLAAERDRVARDVHDVLGHSLTVITVKSELAERLVDLDPARAKDEITQVRSSPDRHSPRSAPPSPACASHGSQTSSPTRTMRCAARASTPTCRTTRTSSTPATASRWRGRFARR